MLLELHVRNLALIEKADVEFGEGLNILTGETGAEIYYYWFRGFGSWGKSAKRLHPPGRSLCLCGTGFLGRLSEKAGKPEGVGGIS